LATARLLQGRVWDKPDPYRYIYFERPQEQLRANDGLPEETRNVAQKLEETGKRGVVFWGSQSGTAEGFAERLSRNLRLRFGLDTFAADLSDYDPESIALVPESKIVFFI